MRLWLLAAALAGLITAVLLSWLATGPLRRDAALAGALVALFVLGLAGVRRPPPEARNGKASLPRTGKAVALALLLLLTLAGGLSALQEALRGYPPLPVEPLLTGEPAEAGFYTVEGRPMVEASYQIQGPEGRRFLAPLDRYQGRVVLMLAERPSAEPVVLTGRLRENIRSVQTTSSGRAEGPFLPLYRGHMRLPPDAPVYFLDPSERAGLNLRALALLLAPLLLFLLLLGVPTRPG